MNENVININSTDGSIANPSMNQGNEVVAATSDVAENKVGNVINIQTGNSNTTMAPTTLNQLQGYGKGVVVRFSDFAEGQPLVARVRRPSMLVLAKSGKIPNTLMSMANDLFAEGANAMSSASNDMLNQMYDLCEILAKSTLIEPSYDQIKEANMELTDEQMMEIFSYSQSGVKALENFREVEGDSDSTQSE